MLQIYQLAKLPNQLLSVRIIPLGLLNDLVVLAITKSHELHKTPARFERTEAGSRLLVHLKLLTPQPYERLAETPHQANVLDTLLAGNNISVGLK